ncbi:3,2-trans-enoyl-CoA isomerase [Lachnellula willkommii]|uniref:3,2-trans-enoyl-CoA isomerase n=1 Tax=Lachnellula willkommii TaxID=215461 RepID=A0A559MBC6_9HELO|nr:3,2-trans-enoyl-CoA isomerase [Lachnellula willkommii]
MTEPILFETQGFIAKITLNIEKKLNALTGDLIFQLGSLLEEIAERGDIYVTLLTGNGRYFSSGADLASLGSGQGTEDQKRKYWLETRESYFSSSTKRCLSALYLYANFSVASHNMRNCKAFYEHPKILIAALNGPVIGYPACLIAFCDFVYAVEDAYLATPFASLGLVAEGVSSFAFAQRMGLTKANEALILGKRISAPDLKQSGFLSCIFPKQLDSTAFHTLVLDKIRADFGGTISKDSMLEIKRMIRQPYMKTLDAQNLEEAMVGWRRFVKGVPQQHFRKVAEARKKGSKM